MQQYYRDVRISSPYEGKTGIQSQDLLGTKVSMQNGKGLAFLIAEIMYTVGVASKEDDLKEYTAGLSEKLNFQKEC